MRRSIIGVFVVFLALLTSCKTKEAALFSRVEIMNFTKEINGIDICEINGQVKNTGEESVDRVIVTITLYRGNQVLESATDFIITGINFEPGQIASFNLWFEEIENWNDVNQIKYDLTWAKGIIENSSAGYL